MTKISYKAAGVVYREVDNGHLYLILKTSNGHCVFPKGTVKMRESKERAAKRETMEETGLTDVDIRMVKGFEEKASWIAGCKEKECLIDVTYYLFESRKGEIKLSVEHVGYGWIKHPDALGSLGYTERGIVKKAEEFLFHRQHTLTIDEFLKRR
jgi:8-oxo-dGTP pyrophosphatase MutT (NUDIX family)